MIGGVVSLCVGVVGTCKDLISHQDKPVRVIVGGLEDHVEGQADRSCTVLKWSREFRVCEDAQGDDRLSATWNMDGGDGDLQVGHRLADVHGQWIDTAEVEHSEVSVAGARESLFKVHI